MRYLHCIPVFFLLREKSILRRSLSVAPRNQGTLFELGQCFRKLGAWVIEKANGQSTSTSTSSGTVAHLTLWRPPGNMVIRTVGHSRYFVFLINYHHTFVMNCFQVHWLLVVYFTVNTCGRCADCFCPVLIGSHKERNY